MGEGGARERAQVRETDVGTCPEMPFLQYVPALPFPHLSHSHSLSLSSTLFSFIINVTTSYMFYFFFANQQSGNVADIKIPPRATRSLRCFSYFRSMLAPFFPAHPY